jgi:hypothetical protein
MLLIDQILQRQCPDFEMLIGERALDHLIKDLTAAGKFVLDRSLAMAADAVDLEELKKVLPQCRLPFKNVWIEVCQIDRPRYFNGPIAGGDVVPRRVGMFARAISDDRLRFLADLYWNYPPEVGHGVGGTMYAMLCDLDDDPKPETLAMRQLMRFQVHDPSAGHAFENRVCPIPSEYFQDFMPHFVKATKEAQKEISDRMLSDWNSEPAFWWAVLALLNCRNVVDVRTPDLGKLNKARIKRGAAPLAEHKVLKLRLPGTKRSSISGEAATTIMRGHWVRGHFKARKSGLYWWSNFFRGDPTRMIAKTYNVSTQQKNATVKTEA